MDRNAFEKLVAGLEAKAHAHPRVYRTRVVLLAILGYAYLAAIMAFLIALLGLSALSLIYLKALAFKLIIVLGGFTALVVRAMWVEITPPRGIRIEARQAPALFARIDRLRKALAAPKFHHVLITDEFNAGVVRVARLGIFGWPRNYLVLGLPLMKCLTHEQLDAVLAHEFGHLAGGHARIGNWLYRLRMTWSQLQDELRRSRSRGAFLFNGFFNWYVPYFNAYSFPLARANEYEADRISAQLTSPRAAAEALTGVNVISQYLGERFWPGIFSRADDEPEPHATPYNDLGRGLSEELAGEEMQRWIAKVSERKSSAQDTHPSLSDRLRAIGENPMLAPPQPGRAADTLLGDALPRIIQQLDSRWQDHVIHDWSRHYEEVRQARQQLAALREKAERAQLTAPEEYELALLEDKHGVGPDAVVERLRALHAKMPDEAIIAFALGQRLLLRDDAGGVALVEAAMRHDEAAAVAGAQVLRDYYWRAGNRSAADEWHARMCAGIELRDAAQAERSRVLITDTFDPHGLDAGAIEALRSQLRAIAGIRAAYLARKRVRHLPESPCYVLGFTTKAWWQRHDAALAAHLQNRIVAEVTLPGPGFIFNAEKANRAFARKFRQLQGSRVL